MKERNKKLFTGDKTMTQTQKKTGLILTIDQYGKLQERTAHAIMSGNFQRAEYLRGIMDRHAPEPILNLRTARA